MALTFSGSAVRMISEPRTVASTVYEPAFLKLLFQCSSERCSAFMRTARRTMSMPARIRWGVRKHNCGERLNGRGREQHTEREVIGHSRRLGTELRPSPSAVDAREDNV